MLVTKANHDIESVNNSNELALLELMEQEGNDVLEFIGASKADNTKVGYGTDWKMFKEWSANKGIQIGDVTPNQFIPATPKLICLYISALAKEGYKFSSIKRRITSITVAHNSAGFMSPTADFTVKEALKGIGNKIGRESTAKEALLGHDIAKMVNTIDEDSLIGKRNKALLLVGFMLGCRRSELVNVDVEDIIVKDGYIDVMLKQKKIHKVEPKRIVATKTPNCPVNALVEWLNTSGIIEGAVFRRIDRHGNILNRLTDKSVYDVIKKHAEPAGLDASKYGGHSLRSGFATHATNKGWSEQDIQNHLGHTTPDMTRRYVQEAKRQGKDYAALSIDLG